MLQDRNTNVKVDAWIKQFNEEQKVQDQRIANLEETEKTVQNATCFDGCTSAQWKDYIANNPATDITADNFSVHNNTSEIKMGSNVELKSGSSKVDVDSSSVTNETQFTNQFSEVSKAKTEIYSGDDSTHFEAKAECGPEGKSSCIRVSADYSLLNTSTSNTDFGNYYFSNQKAEFTFPNHCFEFCCDGLFFIDGQPSSVTNAICFDGCDSDCWRDYIAAQIPAKAQDSFCFDGCDSDCWRDYIAAQIPSKAQDTYCFDGCDATCWRNYIDSHAGNPSSITSPDGCALVTTTCNGNKICLCDQTFTLGFISGGFYDPAVTLLSRCNAHYVSLGCNLIESAGRNHCNILTSNSDVGPSGNYICVVTDSGKATNFIYSSGGTATNYITASGNSGINCICSTSCNEICSCINCMCARSTSGAAQNNMDAWSDSGTGQNYLRAKTNNLLWSEGPNYLQALCNELQATNRNVLKAARYNQICSGNHCWEFCCDGNLYKDGVCVL